MFNRYSARIILSLCLMFSQGEILYGMEIPQTKIEIKNFPEIPLAFDVNPFSLVSQEDVEKAVMVFEQAVGWLGEDVFLNNSYSFKKEKKPSLFDFNKDIKEDYYDLLKEKNSLFMSDFSDRLNQRRKPLIDLFLSFKKLLPLCEIINWQITDEQAELLTDGANPHWHSNAVGRPVNRFQSTLNITIPKKICPLELITISRFSFSNNDFPEISNELLDLGNEQPNYSLHFFGPRYHAKALQFLQSLEKKILKTLHFSEMNEFHEWLRSVSNYLQGDHVCETGMYSVYNEKILRYQKAYEYILKKFEEKTQEEIKDGILRKNLKKFGLKMADFTNYQAQENKRTLFLLALEKNFQCQINPLLQKQEQLHNLLGAIEIARLVMDNFYQTLGKSPYQKLKLLLKDAKLARVKYIDFNDSLEPFF